MKKRFTDLEIETLKKRTTDELVLQDPKPVLDDLGIEYKELGSDSYRMNLRGENTPSAFISLRKGKWSYIDFGDRTRGGNIANVAMDATGKNFKDSLNYSLSKLGLKNYLDEALKQDSITELSQVDRERIKTQREANKQREKSHQISKVIGVFEVSTNQLACDYLASRGITKIPPEFKVISGEYENKYGQKKKVFGIGVLTVTGGADIHFLQKLGDLKTFQLGEKEISFFQNPTSNKIAVFESKMDYAAAYQQMDLSKVNVIIANSTSNSNKVANLLKEKNLTSNVMIFNQNDLAGYKFVQEIAKSANIEHFKSISYDVLDEIGADVNDLLIDGVKLADRIEIRPVEYFQQIAISLENIKKMQQEKPLTPDDLKLANKNQERGHEKER